MKQRLIKTRIACSMLTLAMAASLLPVNCSGVNAAENSLSNISSNGEQATGPVITGMVTRDGYPEENATVTLMCDDKEISGLSYTTGLTGKYQFPRMSEPLGSGTFKVVARKGNEEASHTITDSEKSQSTITANLEFPPGFKDSYQVSGFVKNDKGDIVEGAKVTLSDGKNKPYETNSASGGFFNFGNKFIPRGEYTLTVTKDGYDTFSRTEKLESTEQDITLSPISIKSKGSVTPSEAATPTTAQSTSQQQSSSGSSLLNYLTGRTSSDSDSKDSSSSSSDKSKLSGKGKYKAYFEKSGKGAVYVRSALKNGTKTAEVPATVTLSGKKYRVVRVGGFAFTIQEGLKTVYIGSNVKKLSPDAFSGSDVSTLIIKSSKLTKEGVKNSLRGSSVKKVKISKKLAKKLGKARTKKLLRKYRRIFRVGNTGTKVKVTL